MRFYTNAVSQASRAFAAGVFIIGLLLIGFGVLIYALPKFFATLAASVFFIAGVGCGITAVKVFRMQRRLERMASEDPEGYRKNVQIRSSEYDDQ